MHSDALTVTKQELINTQKEEVKLNKHNISEEIKEDELSENLKKVRYFLFVLALFIITKCL